MAVPFISIIVPVYKAEQTLSRCLDSILVQTFTDFELLLIDDGSPDASGVICDEYALKDSRIRVFHKENGGVGSARNLGLDNARGEWICFVDSDDWIKECFLSEFCTNIDGVDLVISGYRQFGDSSEIIVFNSALYDLREKVDLGQENNAVCVLYCPWRKLFRFSIIRERRIRFTEDLFIAEDTEKIVFHRSEEVINFWRENCIGDVTVIMIPGNHLTCFTDVNNIQKLVNMITEK